MIKAVIFDIFNVFYKPGIILGSYDEEMISLAARLREKGIKIFAISNSYGAFKPLQEVFDKIYFCSDMGIWKPDPRAFEYFLREENLKPKECVYFDDTTSNVKSAESLGIKSFLFQDAKETEKILKDLKFI